MYVQRAFPRRAFTLIELLVVITIGISLSAMALLVIPKFNENRVASRAADQLQGWLLIAKTKALRDGAPRGLRITYNAQKFATQVQYIEQPEGFRPRAVKGSQIVYMELTVANATRNQATLTLNDLDTAQRDNLVAVLTNALKAGDTLILRDENRPTFRITAVGAVTPTMESATKWRVDHTVTLASEVESAAYSSTGIRTSNFTFIRQPQALVGESGMELPVDTLIDLTDEGNKFATGTNLGTTGGFLDVLFEPSGKVITLFNPNETSGADTGTFYIPSTGRTILEVRHAETGVGESTLVTIYSRTGSIAAHPVDSGSDRYALTKDGMNSGL